MCGIIGIIAKSKQKGFIFKHNQMFRQMLFADTLRGKDGTGVYTVNKHGNVEWAKEASPAPTFIEENKVNSLITSISWDKVIAVGHNRAATMGKKTDENSHPFVEDNIILVHNGTIRNQNELNTDVEVDSHAICHAIKEHGIVKALPLIHGAFALAVYDLDTKQFYLVRNSERPLYFAEGDDFWIFGSEPWLLYGMAWRNGFKLEKLREIPVATLFSFKLRDDNDSVEFFEEPISLEKPKKLNITLFNRKNQPKKQKPALLQKPLSSKNDKKIKEPFTWLPNDLICFTPKEYEVMPGGGAFRIIGNHYLFESVEVSCYVDNSYSKFDVVNLIKEKELVADIQSIVTRDSKTRIYVRGPSISKPLISRNGFVVNEEVMCNLTTCSETGCINEITDDIIEDSYIKINKQGKIKCACPECISHHLQQNPSWGNILIHDQTKARSVQTLQ